MHEQHATKRMWCCSALHSVFSLMSYLSSMFLQSLFGIRKASRLKYFTPAVSKNFLAVLSLIVTSQLKLSWQTATEAVVWDVLLKSAYLMQKNCWNFKWTKNWLTDWVKVSMSQSRQNRSFRRCSSLPISWLSTEETKPNTTKASNTRTKWSKLTWKNTQTTKPK